MNSSIIINYVYILLNKFLIDFIDYFIIDNNKKNYFNMSY